MDKIRRNTETKIRLIGLNSLLSDLYGKQVLISHILKKSGFTHAQVEKIRIKHLDIFLYNVCHNIYHYIYNLVPEHYAKAIKFCYYLDGKKPNEGQESDKQFEIAKRRISQRQSEAISSLRDKNRLQTLKRIFATSAKYALKTKEGLKPEKPKPEPEPKLSQRDIRKKHGLKIKSNQGESYDLSKRSSHDLTEAKKKWLLRHTYKVNKGRVRVADDHKTQRKMFNPWLGPDRYRSNWW